MHHKIGDRVTVFDYPDTGTITDIDEQQTLVYIVWDETGEAWSYAGHVYPVGMVPTMDISGWRKYAEIRKYAEQGGMTLAQAVEELANNGLFRKRATYRDES